MLRIAFVITATLALAALAAPRSAPAAQAKLIVAGALVGTVTQVDSRAFSLTIKTPKGMSVTFSFYGARFLGFPPPGGFSAPLCPARVGDRISVSLAPGTKVAQVITLLSSMAAASASGSLGPQTEMVGGVIKQLLGRGGKGSTKASQQMGSQGSAQGGAAQPPPKK